VTALTWIGSAAESRVAPLIFGSTIIQIQVLNPRNATDYAAYNLFVILSSVKLLLGKSREWHLGG